MPAATYYQPIEAILDGNCNYEYYNHTGDTFSKTSRSRICHVELAEENEYNKDIALLIFTIRNQSGAWKIHSEGPQRMDPGAMVPLRNATVKLAKEKGWKFIAVAVAGEDTPETENISQYVVSIESYTYGDETVGVLTKALEELQAFGNPDFHRFKADINGKEYSLAFIKKENFIEYLTYFDDRPHGREDSTGASFQLLVNAVVSNYNYSVEELVEKLNDMYCSAASGNQSNAIRMFGFKYAESILALGISPQKLVDDSIIDSSSYGGEISKAINMYNSIKNNEYGVAFIAEEKESVTTEDIDRNYFGMHIKELNNCLDPDKPHVCIGWSVLGDLTEITTKSQIEELYDEYFTDKTPNSRGQDIGQICRFKFDMHVGDFVVYGDGSSGHIGIVESDYYFEEQDDQIQSTDYTNNKRVKWLKSVPYTEMPQNLRNAVGSAMSIFSLNEYKDEILSLLNESKKNAPITFNTGYKSKFARNRILFGAPGTGKSFTLNGDRKEILYGDREADESAIDLSQCGEYERVTFHPDYSYANFVGTYKPIPCKDESGKDGITYEYVPGPFMRTYVKALLNSKTETPKPYLLIIEEINRANVAAVFGDVFQLLDRDENEISEYPIQASEDMKKYLAKVLNGSPEDYSEIRIPDNMFIWATMNSADQGVFPMDTAFKRRWDFTYLGIDDSEDGIAGKTVVIGKGKQNSRIVEWNELRKAINEELLKYKVNEDKLMGPYFISKKNLPEGNIIDPEEFSRIFKNKVIMYLFDDAAKQKRATLFEGCEEKSRNQYSKICNEFDEKGVLIFGSSISDKFTVIPEDDEQ